MLLFAWGPARPGAALEAQWPSRAGSFQRTGLSKNQGPVQGGLKWKFETGGAVLSSITVGVDGCIHVACEDAKLYTLGPDGKSVWVADVNMPLVSAPTIGLDGGLYVGSRNGKLLALDTSGQRRWTCTTGDTVYGAPAVAPNGHIYAGSSDGALYALDPHGGELWRFKTKGPGRSPSGARRAVCLANLRQLTQAWNLYAQDNGGRLVNGDAGESPLSTTKSYPGSSRTGSAASRSHRRSRLSAAERCFPTPGTGVVGIRWRILSHPCSLSFRPEAAEPALSEVEWAVAEKSGPESGVPLGASRNSRPDLGPCGPEPDS